VLFRFWRITALFAGQRKIPFLCHAKNEAISYLYGNHHEHMGPCGAWQTVPPAAQNTLRPLLCAGNPHFAAVCSPTALWILPIFPEIMSAGTLSPANPAKADMAYLKGRRHPATQVLTPPQAPQPGILWKVAPNLQTILPPLSGTIRHPKIQRRPIPRTVTYRTIHWPM